MRLRQHGSRVLAMVLLGVALGHAATTPGTSDPLTNLRVYLGDGLSGYVAAGCLPTVPVASLTLAAFSCRGYVRDTTENQLYYVAQTAHTLGPLTGGNIAHWLALDKSQSRAVSGWARQPGTHYLWQASAIRPAEPSGALIVAHVLITGGVITLVNDVRPSNPLGASILKVTDAIWGCKLDGMTDDTACWQAVARRVNHPYDVPSINQASSGTIVVPEGTSCLTDTIDWGSTVGLKIQGMSAAWTSAVVPGTTTIKWCGSTGTGKPIWWFKENTSGTRIAGLGFVGGSEALRFRRHATSNSGAAVPIRDIEIRDSFFTGQEIAAIWLGFPLADTTSTDDFERYVIDHMYCDQNVGASAAANAGGCVVANVAQNGYGLDITQSQLIGKQALISQGFQNVRLEKNSILTEVGGVLTVTTYPIYLLSGGGYFVLRDTYTENGLVVRMDAWGGSAGLAAQIVNLTVNSAQTYAAIGSVASIKLKTPALLDNVQVSSAGCTLVRHIDTDVFGYVKTGATSCDIYDAMTSGVAVGYDTPTGAPLYAFQRIDSHKGLVIRRNDDTTPSGTAIEVLRFDEASAVFFVEAATGRVVSQGNLVGVNFVGTNVLLNDLKTIGGAGGNKVVCVDTATGKLYTSSTGIDCSN